MTPILSLRDASFRVKYRPLVDKVSLDLSPGQFVVLVGPNGAGKSTLMRMLSGELRPTSGAAFCEGEPLERAPPWRLACQRAVMTQAVEVTSPFTVAEVVRLGLEGVGKALPAPRKERVIEAALVAAQAQDLPAQPYATLSGGEQRRVQFARALAQREAGASVADRQALLLDEPVAHLDLTHQLGLLDQARRLADCGVAVFAVLHDLNLAMRYADVVALMRKGTLIACGPPSEVLSSDVLSTTFSVDLCMATALQVCEPLVVPTRWLKSKPAP